MVEPVGLLPASTFVYTTLYRPCLQSSTLCHVMPNGGVLRVPQVIEGFGEQAIAKPLSAASGRQANTSLPFKKLRKAPYLSLLLLMELRIA